ncbi:MAG: transglycosylase SLT domain-containing protein, partial [Flavobacteriales bacterium]|nr:transglycosylase SLT domain-containing protein [Flavobacteriales bacterium]
RSYYPELDVSLEISFPQRIAWAVRPNADSLLAALNTWILDQKNARRIGYTYRKYFDSVKSQRERVLSEYSSFSGKRISPYDESLKNLGKKFGWDWRLLSAIVYQESRFNPEAESWAGAYGLMQLMPVTAARYGLDSTSNEEANLEAGVKFLNYLDKFWTKHVPDSTERVKFILASYNCGHGHVLDAMKLARELGMEPDKWEDNVEAALLMKCQPRYYSMEIVKHGYCRGDEATDYVRKVMGQFEHYTKHIQEQPSTG